MCETKKLKFISLCPTAIFFNWQFLMPYFKVKTECKIQSLKSINTKTFWFVYTESHISQWI